MAQPARPAQQRDPMMHSQLIDPPSFADVPTGTNERHACTPSVPRVPGRYGIVINAPKRVALQQGRPLWIPVCGEQLLPTFRHEQAPARLVARNQETGSVHAGDYVPAPPSLHVDGWLLDPIPNDPVPPDTRQALARQATIEAVNMDAAAVAKLPRKAATYEIHMELDGYRSNAVVVEVLEGQLK